MTKGRVALVIAAALLAVLGSIAVAFAQGKQVWELNGSMTMNSAKVETFCDGPHKVYVARTYSMDGPSTLSLFVLQNGCVRQPAEAR